METELPSTSASALAACSSSASSSAEILDFAELSPELLQRKLYFLVDQLKQMHAQLPE